MFAHLRWNALGPEADQRLGNSDHFAYCKMS